MNNKKTSLFCRLGAALLAFVLLFSLVSCGDNPDSAKGVLNETVSRASLGQKVLGSMKKKTLSVDGLGSTFGIWKDAPSFLSGYMYEPTLDPNTLVFACVEVDKSTAEQTAKDFLSKMDPGVQICVVYDTKIAVADGKYILLAMGDTALCEKLESAFHATVAALQGDKQ